LLAGFAVPVLWAQEASEPASGGSSGAIPSAATAIPAILSEGPARAPKVTCAGDQLAISANNATLGSVLTAVHACLGIQIEIPEGAGGARTFEELGPGPEREVLESLLSGTDFNYVIGSPDGEPGKVETVLLMERKVDAAAGASPGERATPGSRRAWIAALKNAQRPAAQASEPSQTTDESAEAPVAEEPAPAAENLNAVPAAAPAIETPASAAEPPAPIASTAFQEGSVLTPSGSPVPELSPSVGPVSDTGKSTTDRIAEMRQMFEQRRQINQGTVPPPAQPQQ